MHQPQIKALLIESESTLTRPYIYLPTAYHLTVASSTQKAVECLKQTLPDIVFLSSSFSVEEMLQLLWLLKDTSTHKLIPLIFVVHWSSAAIHLPGTQWGGKIGIVHTLSSSKEMHSTLERVLYEESV